MIILYLQKKMIKVEYKETEKVNTKGVELILSLIELEGMRLKKCS